MGTRSDRPEPIWFGKRTARWATIQDEDESPTKSAPVDTTIRPQADGLDVLSVFPLCEESRGMKGAYIRAVDFHPVEQWGLVASATRICLHKVDGKSNEKIKDFVFGDGAKIKHAIFARGGKEIWVATQYPGFLWCNIKDNAGFKQARPNTTTERHLIRKFIKSPDGKQMAAICTTAGVIDFISVKTKEVYWSLACGNGGPVDASFSHNGNKVYVMTDSGEVYEWLIESKKCIRKFQDDGNFKGTCIAVSQKHIACGSEQGIVNLYDRSESELPDKVPDKPIKVFKNITTTVDHLKFSNDGQGLAFGTSSRSNSFKMIDVRKMQVQSLTFATGNYGNCGGIIFSPNGGYLAIGHTKGALLYRINNFPKY